MNKQQNEPELHEQQPRVKRSEVTVFLFPLISRRWRRKIKWEEKEFLKLWGKTTLSMWGWESPSLRKWFNPFMTLCCWASLLQNHSCNSFSLWVYKTSDTSKQIKLWFFFLFVCDFHPSNGWKMKTFFHFFFWYLACCGCRQRAGGGWVGGSWGSSETAEVIRAVRRSWWLVVIARLENHIPVTAAVCVCTRRKWQVYINFY